MIIQVKHEDREHVLGEVLQSWLQQSKASEMVDAGVVASWVYAAECVARSAAGEAS